MQELTRKPEEELIESNSLYSPLKTRMKYLKTMLANAGMPHLSETSFLEQANSENIGEFIQALVMHYLDLEASPRKKETVDFVGHATVRLQKKVQESEVSLQPNGRLHKLLESEDHSDLEKKIHYWLSFYHSVLVKVSGIYPFLQDVVQEPQKEKVFMYKKGEESVIDEIIPCELIELLVKLATLKALGKTALGKLPDSQKIEAIMGDIQKKITLIQTFPVGSGFDKISASKRFIITSSPNFGKGFDGNDLEALGYDNIDARFDDEALAFLVSILREDDIKRKNICLNIGAYLRRNPNDMMVTRERLEAEYGDSYVREVFA